jgi:hypothetical protein
MSENKLEFTRNLLVLGNLTVLAWIILAFLGVWFYDQLAGWLLLLFNAFIVYAVLRRLGCSSYYNCKSCSSGFGRIAGVFFGAGYIKEGSVGNRKGLLAFVYVLLFPLPALLLSVSLMQEFAIAKVLVLIGLCAVTVYSLATWHGWKAPKK